jgi:hypothetical protein
MLLHFWAIGMSFIILGRTINDPWGIRTVDMFQTVKIFINTLNRYLCHHGVLFEYKLRLSDAVG